MDLVEFLLARIAEDEAAASGIQRRAQDVQLTLQDPNALGRWIPGWHDWPAVEAIAARVVPACDANRRIVEMCRFVECGPGDPYEDGVAEDVLRLLALPYADHLDYRPEWRP